MAHPELLLLIKFRTALSLEEIQAVAERRMSAFQEVAGLQQKFYLHDAEAGEYAGLYFWESSEALGEFRASALRASIAAAYRAIGEPRVEVYTVMRALRE